jgi:hypothetical protein
MHAPNRGLQAVVTKGVLLKPRGGGQSKTGLSAPFPFLRVLTARLRPCPSQTRFIKHEHSLLFSARLYFIDDAVDVVDVPHGLKQGAAVDRHGAVLRRFVAVVAAQGENVAVKNQADDIWRSCRSADCRSCRR